VELQGLLTRYGQIDQRFNRTVREVKDAIHTLKKDPFVKSGPRSNPDVGVDPVTGEVFPKIPGGGYGDSIGNILEFLER
jgi:hypothetical protein